MSDAVSDSGLRLPCFGQLLGNKQVILSTRTGYVAVDRFLFTELMADCLARIAVDEAWYLATYPDIREAVTAGVVKSAQDHYIRFGYFEHRIPYEIQVDDAWYLAAHPDVKEAIANKAYASAQQHYELTGFSEGRLPRAGFDLFK